MSLKELEQKQEASQDLKTLDRFQKELSKKFEELRKLLEGTK